MSDHPHRAQLEKLAYHLTNCLNTQPSNVLNLMNKITTTGKFPVDVRPSNALRNFEFASSAKGIALNVYNREALIRSNSGFHEDGNDTPGINGRHTSAVQFFSPEETKILPQEERISRNLPCSGNLHDSFVNKSEMNLNLHTHNQLTKLSGVSQDSALLQFKTPRPLPPSPSRRKLLNRINFESRYPLRGYVGPSHFPSLGTPTQKVDIGLMSPASHRSPPSHRFPSSSPYFFSDLSQPKEHFHHKVLRHIDAKNPVENFNVCEFFLSNRESDFKASEAQLLLKDPEISLVSDICRSQEESVSQLFPPSRLDSISCSDTPLKTHIKLYPAWYSKLQVAETLIRSLKVQDTWNPFTIFGSAPKNVVLSDVFNHDTYALWACKEARAANRTINALFKKGYINDPVRGVTRNDWRRIKRCLHKKWHDESRLELDWRMDPLLVHEPIWYVEYSGFYVDKSDEVVEIEVCYCPTPNPKLSFGWTDPRSRRKKGRGGGIMTTNGFRVSGGGEYRPHQNLSLYRIKQKNAAHLVA